MQRNLLALVLILVLFVAGVILFNLKKNINNSVTQILPPESENQFERPSDEEAEVVGFEFILNFVASDPKDEGSEELKNAYNALSEKSKDQIRSDSIYTDLEKFIRVSGTPSEGASVEDLQISDDTSSLIVGLNYVTGRVLRSINMVIEHGEWKIDSVGALDQYPPEN